MSARPCSATPASPAGPKPRFLRFRAAPAYYVPMSPIAMSSSRYMGSRSSTVKTTMLHSFYIL